MKILGVEISCRKEDAKLNWSSLAIW